MSKTSAKNSAALSTAAESAIEVQAENVTPLAITADAQTALSKFAARPAVSATGKAFTSVKDGFELLWAHEDAYATGQNFFRFLWDASKTILSPLLALLWLALNQAYVWIRKPSTRVLVASKWQSVRNWAAPKFGYERDESALKL